MFPLSQIWRAILKQSPLYGNSSTILILAMLVLEGMWGSTVTGRIPGFGGSTSPSGDTRLELISAIPIGRKNKEDRMRLQMPSTLHVL